MVAALLPWLLPAAASFLLSGGANDLLQTVEGQPPPLQQWLVPLGLGAAAGVAGGALGSLGTSAAADATATDPALAADSANNNIGTLVNRAAPSSIPSNPSVSDLTPGVPYPSVTVRPTFPVEGNLLGQGGIGVYNPPVNGGVYNFSYQPTPLARPSFLPPSISASPSINNITAAHIQQLIPGTQG